MNQLFAITDEGATNKRCFRCNSIKPLERFCKNVRKQDGIDTYCKDCARQNRREQEVRNGARIPTPTMTRKICRLCSTVKPLIEFNRHRTGRDGHATECKTCTLVRGGERREAQRSGPVNGVMEKTCRLCGEVKSWENFRARATTCNPCHNRVNRSTARSWELQKRFGISTDQYDALFAAQNGLCALCGKEEKGKRNGRQKKLAVDHCHGSGQVRALLCSLCNRGLGLLHEDVSLLRAAIAYLEKHTAAS